MGPDFNLGTEMKQTPRKSAARKSEPSLRHISCSDSELLAKLQELTYRSREVGRELLRHLAEVDRRRLYLSEACSSMFAYCTQRLGFSEGAAYSRIRVARLSRDLPLVLDYYSSGQVHLAGLVALAPHLNRSNQRELLDAAKGQGKRAIEAWLARRFPAGSGDRGVGKGPRTVLRPISARAAVSTRRASRREAGPASLPANDSSREQFHPASSLSGGSLREEPARQPRRSSDPCREERVSEPAPPAPADARPPALHRLHVTVDDAFLQQLKQAQALLSHSVPDGDVATILALGLDALTERKNRQRFGAQIANGEEAPAHDQEPPHEGGVRRQTATRRSDRSRKRRPAELESQEKANDQQPSPGAEEPQPRLHRYIPAEVRRSVFARDGGRCTFVDRQGRRCGSDWQLELDHIHPFSHGGSHHPDNLRILCRNHNQARESGVSDAWDGSDAGRGTRSGNRVRSGQTACAE